MQGIKLSGGAPAGETFVTLGSTRDAYSETTFLLDRRLVGFKGQENAEATEVTHLRLIEQRDTYISSNQQLKPAIRVTPSTFVKSKKARTLGGLEIKAHTNPGSGTRGCCASNSGARPVLL